MNVKVLLVFSLASLQLGCAKVSFFPSENYKDCSTDGTAKYIDYSDLEYEYVNDTAFFLTGEG